MSKKLNKYQFKHESWGDDWEEYSPNKFGDAYFPYHAAENIAEYIWSEDPHGNPEDVCESIQVKSEDGTIRSYNVSGSVSINWYSSEITAKKT
jgi:hypothetical protein